MQDATYRRFARKFADSTPIRGQAELAAAMHAAGLRDEDVTPDWLLSLRRSWVYGTSDTPFTTELLNRRYFRMLFE
jgi:hypothetical protein